MTKSKTEAYYKMGNIYYIPGFVKTFPYVEKDGLNRVLAQ